MIFSMLYTLIRSFILTKCLVLSIYYFYLQEHSKMTDCIFSGGAVPIKIAQWVCQRKDLFTQECYQALSKVCADVPPHDALYTLKALERLRLKTPLTDWEDTPLGSGSIAQVYRARYRGHPCIVKIRHPGIQMQMQTDIYLLKRCVDVLCFFGNKYLATLDIKQTLKGILKQCDLKIEAKNTTLLYQCFYENPYITFPKIFYKSSEVLIESYSGGYHAEEFIKKYPGKFPQAKAATLAAYMQMFLVDGVIHADCHQGNIKYEVDKKQRIRVHFLDCGVVTKLNYSMRQDIIGLINVLMLDDKTQLIRQVNRLSKTPIDELKFKKKFDENILKLQDNVHRGSRASISEKIDMLLSLLAESRACIDGEIISFLIGYSLIESTAADKDTLTKRAFELIRTSRYFKTTRNNAHKIERVINSVIG